MAVEGKFVPATQCSIEFGPINPAECRRLLPFYPDVGGYVSFEGIVRDSNHGKKVIRLDYEVYEALALREMQRIADQAAEEYKLRRVFVQHRCGSLEVGDIAVLIQVQSRHRAEAFGGCRYVIDSIKHRVPIWKKEYYDDGTVAWSQCHEHNSEPSL